MDQASDKKEFAFVDYDRARVPPGRGTRRLIREHAMRDVATSRKQKGSYARRKNHRPAAGWHAKLHPPPPIGDELIVRRHFPVFELMALLKKPAFGVCYGVVFHFSACDVAHAQPPKQKTTLLCP